MDRGHYEYVTIDMAHKVVVDPGASNYVRGDVVYYTTPKYINGIQGIENKSFNLKESLGINIKENEISRIVGLPGETVEIKKGQVYINDKKLNIFYAYPTVAGMNKSEYLKAEVSSKSTLITNSFEESMDTILIPRRSVSSWVINGGKVLTVALLDPYL